MRAAQVVTYISPVVIFILSILFAEFTMAHVVHLEIVCISETPTRQHCDL